MFSLLFLGAVSVLASLVITPVVRDAFRWMNILDHPDEGRKQHTRPVPRVGGLAIVLSYAIAFAVLLATRSSAALTVRAALPFIWKLLPAAGLVFITGFIDDLFGLKPWQKMSGQFAGALAACIAGIHITSVGGAPNQAHVLEWWSFPLTVLWLLACMNAFNLIDGLDGLASGIGLMASATTLLAALIQLNIPLALAIIPLAGCLLGFLRYNFIPATIFLGDSGSLFVGFLLGCFAVVWSEKSATMVGMAAPLLALGIPLLDTALAVGRRFLRGVPIFSPDRGHIHHRLLDLGLSPRQVALHLYALCGAFALLSLFVANHRQELLILGLFCIAVWVGVRRLHYAEFDIAGRLVAEGWLHHMINSQILLRNFQAKLELAETPEQCWSALRHSYREFGFVEIWAQLGDRTFSEAYQHGPRFWGVEVRFPPGARILLGACRPSKKERVFAPYVDAIRSVLETKIESFDSAAARGVAEAEPLDGAIEALEARL